MQRLPALSQLLMLFGCLRNRRSISSDNKTSKASARRSVLFKKRNRETEELFLKTYLSKEDQHEYRRFSLADEHRKALVGKQTASSSLRVEEGFVQGGHRCACATWWIRQAIIRAIAEKARLIRLPVLVCEQLRTFTQTRHILLEQLRHEPSEHEIAAAMGIRPERVRDLAEIDYEIVSLEQPLGEDHTSSLVDLLEDRETLVLDDLLDQQALREQVDGLLTRLRPRQQLVMRMRFGLLSDRHESTSAITKPSRYP